MQFPLNTVTRIPQFRGNYLLLALMLVLYSSLTGVGGIFLIPLFRGNPALKSTRT
jgi:hypothetical protein